MNLRDLQYLVAVAEHRHFGRAAEACFVSQPTLSTQLRKLEQELGVELIERNPRNVLLTDAGERVVERARVMLREADSIRAIARQAVDPESGSIRLGIFPTLGPYLLPHVVPTIHARFPNLELLLVEEKTEVVLQRLRDGQLDVGILALPVHAEQLHEEPLFEEDFVLAVPAVHPLAGTQGPVTTDVLAGEHVLLLEEGHCLRDQALSVCRLAGADERHGFRATSLETLRQMVGAGVGLTLLPELSVRPPVPPSDAIALVRFAEPVPRRQIAMFWRPTSAYRDFLPKLAALIALVAVLDTGVGLLERLTSSRLGEGLILDLRRRVFEHVQAMPVAFFTRTHTGALVSRLNNDVIGAQRAFTSALSGVVTNVIVLVLTLGVMLRLSWSITLLAVVLLPIFIIPARRVGARVGLLEREAAEHNAAMTSQMTERFSAPGATLVKLFGRPVEEAEAFGHRAERVRDIGVRSAMASAVFLRALTLVSGLALALIYGLGGYLAVQGDLEPGTVVTMALLLNRLYAPLTALATARLDVVTALVSFDRVFEVLDIEPLIQEPAEPTPLPDGPVSVELAGVRFGYPSAEKISLASLEEVAVLDDRTGDEVLHGVSFRVEPGQTVALVGPSGAGKSTIASLVPRLYDADDGVVALGGIDVRDLSFDDLRATVGVVTQDGHLFHDTIRANLLYAAPEADEAALWDALASARLDELIRSLPDGLDTVVGERGYRLSGGERQRLTIARLLLAGPRVVILDEATAHLDSESEQAVQEALAAALAGRTAIVIAHRLSTIKAADAILVIEGGQVVEHGSHLELLARRGRYADLYRTQFDDEPAEAIA